MWSSMVRHLASQHIWADSIGFPDRSFTALYGAKHTISFKPPNTVWGKRDTTFINSYFVSALFGRCCKNMHPFFMIYGVKNQLKLCFMTVYSYFNKTVCSLNKLITLFQGIK